MIPTVKARSDDQTLELRDGGSLRYTEQGEGSPILLVHGTGGIGWFDSASRLARSHRVITYDRRGFGGSTGEPSAEYLRRHIDDAAELLRCVAPEPATVVGHSWGAVVALGLAARYPAVVGRLVLMEPPYHVKRHMTPGFLLSLIRVQLLRRLSGAQAGTRTFLRFAMRRTDGVTSYDRLPSEVRTEIAANAAASMVELDAGTGEELAEEQVAAIAVPVLLLEGALSQKVFRNSSSRLAGKLPRAHVQVLPGASHLMHFDAPADFERAVLSIAG